MASFWRSGSDYDIGSESAALRKIGEPFLAKELKSERLNKNKPLLVDFGCWSGRHLRLLERVAEKSNPKIRDAKDRVIGIDEPFAKERLAEAGRAHKGFELISSGISNTGLPSSSVDGAISWRVLHNLTRQGEWTAAIREIRRVLKDGAPMIVSIRATHLWMPSTAPVPLLYKTYTHGADRDDLYFSELACYSMFKFYGFDLPFKATLIDEEEVVEGKRINNKYWMLLMVCNKSRELDPSFNNDPDFKKISPKRELPSAKKA